MFQEHNSIRKTALGLEVGLLSEFSGLGGSAEMILLSLGVHIIYILF